MSNATQAKLHYNLLIEYSNKLARHLQQCTGCTGEHPCDVHLYLLGEIEAAKNVYNDTVERWLARQATECQIPECPNHCQ